VNLQKQTNDVKPALVILDPLVYPDWDNLILTSPARSFFHTSSWAYVLHDTYGYRPCYLTRINCDKLEVLVPVMEIRSLLTGKRGVSLPFTDYCDPIVNDISDWKSVIDFLKEYGNNAKWKYLEFRGGEQWFGQIPPHSFFYRHDIKLSTDTDSIYAQLKSSIKRNIKKASREGVTITRHQTLDAVTTFYDLHCLTRKRHGVPPQPFAFFQQIYIHIINKNHGHIFLAMHKGKTIAAAVYFNFGNEVIYKFSASDSLYLHLRPNHLLKWEAIQWFCHNGYKNLSFGRTEFNNNGLRHFKKAWGAKEEEIKYYRYDINKKEFRSGDASDSALTTMIFQHMPISLSKIIGTIFYPHVG